METQMMNRKKAAEESGKRISESSKKTAGDERIGKKILLGIEDISAHKVSL